MMCDVLVQKISNVCSFIHDIMEMFNSRHEKVDVCISLKLHHNVKLKYSDEINDRNDLIFIKIFP